MILVKTEMGLQVLKDRSVRLTPRQRSAFILFDGKRSVAEVLQASQVLQDDVDTLVGLGLLARPAEAPAAAPASLLDASSAVAEPAITVAEAVGRSARDRYQAAYPIATQLTAGLGLRGFRLNLAVEAASNCDELLGLVPKIRAAVGPDKVASLEKALAR